VPLPTHENGALDIIPPAEQAALHICARVTGVAVDEGAVVLGKQALQAALPVVEGGSRRTVFTRRRAQSRRLRLLFDVQCRRQIDKAGFSLAGFPNSAGYPQRLLARPA
jgi:hypothetical protein